MQKIKLKANGLNFTALKTGEGEKLALFLHGFPETPHSLEPLMQKIAGIGYTAVAPFQRGYAPTEIPERLRKNSLATVQISELADDAAAIVTELGYTEALLIGHDWGAIAAYAAANNRPALFTKLVTMSVPPLSTFLRNTVSNPMQILRSWYILFFQLRLGLPEKALEFNNSSLLSSFWSLWSPNWDPPEEKVAEATSTLNTDGSLTAALAYYRGLFQPQPDEWPLWARSRSLSFDRIKVPGLVLFGTDDHCIGAEMFRDTRDAFEKGGIVREIPAAGHFLPLEATEAVFNEIQAFLKA